MGEKKMAKYKESLVKKIRIEQEENQKQKKLQEKYGINENVRIVERNNMGKFVVKTIGKCIRIVAVIILFILAAIGLTALIYPEIRQELLQVLGGVLAEGKNLIRG
ncbi:hypothetical protein CLONEX_02629 [[Clostridium] nexile DSM 1787]|nr:hypothetical protein CLONEX_02629 [[Clostridium] nexile DSM 1787]